MKESFVVLIYYHTIINRMLRIPNALKGVFLMIVSAHAVNTSNLQEDAVYDLQYAQEEVLITDLAQLEAEA